MQYIVVLIVTIPAKADVKMAAKTLAKVSVSQVVVENVQGVVAMDVKHLVKLDAMELQANKAPFREIPGGWQAGSSKSITFIVTKDCQLACKYCYLVGKNTSERMSFDVARSATDYILSMEKDPLFAFESVIWDFIGGEPFLEIDLIDKICDYIKCELFRLNHHWFNSYRFSFSTNGINYASEKVQKFIKKNLDHLSIGITIDGTKEKHDLNRIYKRQDNEQEHGSYDDVVKNIPLWLSQFPDGGTKVTISSNDIPFIKESVLHLYGLGIHDVSINCVFENVWKDGDDQLLEKQLIELADTIIDNELYKDFACSFFSETIGKPLDPENDNNNWCGAGKMLAIDAAGNFYPCTRFAQYSLRNKCARIIGNITEGINRNKVRPFLCLTRTDQSRLECIECDVASGCAWCQGENYDSADSDTIFQRSTAICKMHKARVRANNYYWNRLYFKENNK
ncbi:MAG: radical SAM peptide maturase, CXXX-repeat target family [Bacteroidales bacterium]|nr:radical SAM peptide maturase, CXXX-repeat target family [Bacteroidales bacterium]